MDPRRKGGSLADRLRGSLAELADDFRRSDRFFKMKAGIIAAWCLVSAGTLWGACFHRAGGELSSLGAEVQMLPESFVGGAQILVRNESSDLWTDLTFELPGGFIHKHDTLRPGDQLVLSVSEFRKGTTAPPKDLKPRSLTISCKEGKASAVLSAGK